MQTLNCKRLLLCVLCTVSHISTQCYPSVSLPFLKRSIKLKANNFAYERISLFSCEWIRLSVSLYCVVLIECALYKIHPTRSCSVCFLFLLTFQPKALKLLGMEVSVDLIKNVLLSYLHCFSFLSPTFPLIRCWVFSHCANLSDSNSF